MNDKKNLQRGIIAGMILVAALTRLLPHPPNFTAIGAMSLFGAAWFSRKYLAFVVPFAALWVTDLLMNNLIYAKAYPEFYNGFAWFGNPYVYLGFALIAGLGFVLLKKVSPLRLLGASFAASVLFFLVTNFGAWMVDPMYPKTAAGLGAAYIAGIPFFWNTMAGDLFFTAVLFGSFELVRMRFPKLASA